MLLVGDEEITHTVGNRVIAIHDFHSESLQRPVADIMAADQLKIRAMFRVQAHRVVKVEKASASFDK